MPAHLIAEEGPLRGLLLNLEEGTEWIVGRDPDEADFVVEDTTVSRKHARLIKSGQTVLIENLSRVNPILVNDEQIEGPVQLKEGDRVQIGHTAFLYSDEALPNVEAPPPKKKKKKEAPSHYDDIFGELEEPSPPSPTEPEDIKREIEETKEETHYDTIFEGGTDSGEVPFNLLSSTPLLLKVISGPNAGAEIGIEKGRSYVIGKDPDSCDIVFQDLSVSKHHARLYVNDEGLIELEDLGSKNGTLVSGTPILEKRLISPQDMIALGTTVFLVIDREAPQETIYSPMVPSYEAPKIADESSPTAEGELAPVEEDWKKKPLPTKHLVMGASFLAIFLIVFLSFFSLFKSEQLQVAKKEPVEHVKEALDKFGDVQFSFNPASGKLFLVGHVLTSVDFQEMNYRIGLLEWIQSVENNVVIDELVWKMTNDVLNDNAAWRSVSVHSSEAGKFVANGYLQTNAEAAALSDYLTVNFPYLDRLQNDVVVEENLTVQLQSLIQSKGLGGVTFQVNNGEVILGGRYSNKMDSEFEEFVKQINSIKGIARVKNFALAVSPSAAGIDISGEFRVGGSSILDGRGYSVVLNGKIFTIGDLVAGMKITSIESNTILLEKDGLKYRIDYAK
jgi:type III secretion system YscD/HrpQ family protein